MAAIIHSCNIWLLNIQHVLCICAGTANKIIIDFPLTDLHFGRQDRQQKVKM